MRYKDLFRKLDRNLDDIERSDDAATMLSAILKRLVDDFREDLGLVGGRIYARRADHYELIEQYPDSTAPTGFKVPLSYGPVQRLLRESFVLFDIGDPGVDRNLEAALDVNTFAAICIGERCLHIIAFTLEPHSDREHVVYTLNTIRHVINLRRRKQRLEDRVDQAREIQLSLLPRTIPPLAGYDIHGATEPAEEVGGDLYDVIKVSDRSLGVAVVDSAGHGLPAALQARDAIIGLRMGVEERMRITATVEKLNRVINRSALASKFISMFYGELEANGTLVYCNAGHNPPLLRNGGGFEQLRRGGRVLGPSPDALYERGHVVMHPGAALLVYTDGITEAENPQEQSFGVDRLKEIMSRLKGRPARELVETVFTEVRRFSGREIPVDDQTVVAVVRS